MQVINCPNSDCRKGSIYKPGGMFTQVVKCDWCKGRGKGWWVPYNEDLTPLMECMTESVAMPERRLLKE